jgi:hypothetical protein
MISVVFAQLIQIVPILQDKILFNIPPFGGVTKDVDTSQILQCTKGKARLGSSFGLVVGSQIPKVSHLNVIFNLNQVLVFTKF